MKTDHRHLALLALVSAPLLAWQATHTAHAQTSLATDAATLLVALPAEPYLSDLAVALSATSDAVRERHAAVTTARATLNRVVAGLSVTAQAAPKLEFERDLTDPSDQGAWETDIDVSIDAAYRRDTQAITRARLALATAESRLRDQLRADLQRALLALSAQRLDARSASDAELAAEEALGALRAAEQGGATDDELLTVRITAELALNAVERAHADALAASEAAALLGLAASAPVSSVLVTGPTGTLRDLSPATLHATVLSVPAPEQHSRAQSLLLQMTLASAQANASAFTVLREIEVYGGYENRGFEADGRLALVTGVPLVGAGVSWTNGEDDVGFTVGVGATLRLTDATARDAAAAAQAVTDAQAEYAGFLDAQVAAELAARRAAELEFEEFGLARLQQQLLEDQLAANAENVDDRDLQRLNTAARRAQDATERAWQRYVRTLVNYLGIVDATWRADVLEER